MQYGFILTDIQEIMKLYDCLVLIYQHPGKA